MDDFKNPWREAREQGYDRTSGEGYYRNAYDFVSARELLLGPAGRHGSGEVTLWAHDSLTGEDHRGAVVDVGQAVPIGGQTHRIWSLSVEAAGVDQVTVPAPVLYTERSLLR